MKYGALTVLTALTATVALAACSNGISTEVPSSQPGPAEASVLGTAPLTYSGLPDGGTGVPLSSEQVQQAPDTARVDILIDGWSLLALGGQVRVVTGTVSTPVAFDPVTKADINALLATTPQVVTATLARTVTPDRSVNCDARGCRTDSGPVDLAWIENPADVPTFGESYAEYGVSSLLYVASVDMPVEAEFAGLTGSAGKELPLMLRPTPLFEGEEPNAGNGYWRNRYLVAGSFGNVWTLAPAWLDGAESFWVDRDPRSGSSNATETVTALKSSEAGVPHLGGLTAPWPAAGALSASQLTYYSSPTTGCGPHVICVPVPVTSTVTSETSDVVTLCPATGGSARLPAVLSTVSAQVTFPSATSQFGAWGGASPDEFESVPAAGGANGGGLPPLLASGAHDLHFSAVSVYSAPVDETAVPEFDTVAGQLTQYLEGLRTPQDGLSDWAIADQLWTVCP